MSLHVYPYTYTYIYIYIYILCIFCVYVGVAVGVDVYIYIILTIVPIVLVWKVMQGLRHQQQHQPSTHEVHWILQIESLVAATFNLQSPFGFFFHYNITVRNY